MLGSMCVPLDGSPWSEQALPLAISIARRSGADLTLVRVHVPVIYVFIGDVNLGGVPIADTLIDADVRASERAALDQLRSQLSSDSDLRITCALLDGPVAGSLAEHVAASRYDLVVMTTHGRGAFSRFWLGSVADSFIRHSTTPTLLIRPHDTPIAQIDAPALRRILIPLDGSLLAEQIIPAALALGETQDAEYTLLHVDEAEPSTLLAAHRSVEIAPIRPLHSTSQHYLDAVAERLRAHGHRVSITVATGPAAPTILRHAQASQADLIALATHGRSGLPRLALGSVADKIIRGADTPILLIRPTAPTESITHV